MKEGGFLRTFQELLRREGLFSLANYVLKTLTSTILLAVFNREYLSYYELEARLSPKSSPLAIYQMLSVNPQQDVVVDVGCGDGETLGAISKDNAIGVEISRLRAYEIKKHGNAIVADAQYLPFRDSVADVIVASEILEHLQQPWKCLMDLYYILKNDGKLGIVTPNDQAYKIMRLTDPSKLVKLSYLRYKPQHFHDLSLVHIASLLKQTKFKIREVKAEIGSWKMFLGNRYRAVFHWYVVCSKE